MGINTETVTDADGNQYQTVRIGSQVWMAENLKTTKYNDGTPIPLVTVPSEWKDRGAPAYCWYDNDIGNKHEHGALYKWHAVGTGKLAPKGWHVPTEAEWIILEQRSMADRSVFAALPGGHCSFGGDFDLLGIVGYWWASTERGQSEANCRLFKYSKYTLEWGSYDKEFGLSVRLLRD